MVQESWPWPGTTLGDAGPYSDDDWDNMWETLYGSGIAPYNNRGVIRNWLNELEVTEDSPNAVNVDTGAALVHGKFYRNTAIENVFVDSSSGAPNWRVDLICLQRDRGAQTIRIACHANPSENDPSYPVPTQDDNTIWEIPLWAVQVDDAGAITLIADLRDYVSDLIQPKRLQVYSRGAFLPGLLPADVYHYGQRLGLNNDGYFEFVVPSDYISTREAILYISGLTVMTSLTLDFRSQGGPCGGQLDAWSDSTNIAAISYGIKEIVCVDVTAGLNHVAMAPYNLVGCRVTPTVIDVGEFTDILMLVLRYV